MQRPLFALVLVAIVPALAGAQEAFPDLTPPPAAVLSAPVAPGQEQPQMTTPSMTPEMWIYSQEIRRHDDPAQAVRRKAELRASQRMTRLAALQYFGMSNSRPQAQVTPMMGLYSPAWLGNGQDGYNWSGYGWPGTTVRIETIQR